MMETLAVLAFLDKKGSFGSSSKEKNNSNKHDQQKQQQKEQQFWKKAVCAVVLVFLIWVIGDNENDEDDGMNVFVALRNHEPSGRIFRSMLQVNLILWCAAFSIYIWRRHLTISKSVVGVDVDDVLVDLLFEPAFVRDPSHGGRLSLVATIDATTTHSATTPTTSPRKYHDDAVNNLHLHHHHEPSSVVQVFTDDALGDTGGGLFSESKKAAAAATNSPFSEGARPIEDFSLMALKAPSSSSSSSSSASTASNQKNKNGAFDADYESDGEVILNENGDGDDDNNLHYTKLHSPSVSALMHAALNMLLHILVALFLFTLFSAEYLENTAAAASSSVSIYFWRWFSRIAAPTFPLLLFVYLLKQAIWPLQKRFGFWVIVSQTVMAPWHQVTFRDGIIGDILTSTVRPAQDIAFTVFYIIKGLDGWWSPFYWNAAAAASQQQFTTAAAAVDGGNGGGVAAAAQALASDPTHLFLDRADASVPALEKSWLLHTVVLPMCMVSPLWWRFLQTLRQSFDEKQRWPYLGNSMKYFVAAQVAMFGLFQPHLQHNIVWLICFVGATVYQIFWDIFMDWNLLEQDNASWCRFRLRSRRLYNSTGFYWFIFFTNIVLRFCWTLTFIPPRYLDSTGVLTETFGSLAFLTTHIIASAEIVRRTLWGLLRVEWEAAKQLAVLAPPPSQEEQQHQQIAESDKSSQVDLSSLTSSSLKEQHQPFLRDDEMKMSPMQVKASNMTTTSSSVLPFSLSLPQENMSSSRNGGQQPLLCCSSDMSNMNDVQILGELCLYATIFCLLGSLAAAHRGTL